MKDLRQVLLVEFSKGPWNKQRVDELLSAKTADPRADLRTVLNLATLPQLRKLQSELEQGNVITCSYQRKMPDGREQGCLVSVLLGIHSNRDLVNYNYSTEDELMAASRAVRFWDYGRLTPSAVLEVLAEVIRERESLNHEEELAIVRARRGPGDAPAYSAVISHVGALSETST